MNFLGRLERRFGHLGIPRLIQYIIGLSILGNVINIINPYFYASYLSLDIYKVLHGQIWRYFFDGSLRGPGQRAASGCGLVCYLGGYVLQYRTGAGEDLGDVPV